MLSSCRYCLAAGTIQSSKSLVSSFHLFFKIGGKSTPVVVSVLISGKNPTHIVISPPPQLSYPAVSSARIQSLPHQFAQASSFSLFITSLCVCQSSPCS